MIYVKTTSKKYLLYRMSDALANKLRIRSQLCREFLAEFLGTFILIVSWSLIYDYGYSYKGIVLFIYFCILTNYLRVRKATLTKELFYSYIFVL